MKFLRFILFPIVPVYFVVTWFRNLMYDMGWKSSKSYGFPILCVGNLSTGGTGKTPMVEYLIRLLKDDLRLATLSRGYGRKTKGFVLGNRSSNAESLGDEPFQFYNKFSANVLVAVDANRQEGITQLIKSEPKPQLIVLDDAFQHRKVTAGFYVMLTTYANLYTKDFVLPSGNLREPKSGAKRANIIVVTKCPDGLTTAKKQTIISEIKPLEYQSVFFSSISYSTILYSEDKSVGLNELSNFKLITGIANATPLVDFLTEKDLDFEHIAFKDHHNFSLQEIERFSQYDCIVTTEKDYMRLKNEVSLIGKLYYLPIKVEIDNAEQFNTLIKDFALH